MYEGCSTNIIFVLIIIYAVSPVDFLPGLVDDIVVLLLGLLAVRKVSSKSVG